MKIHYSITELAVRPITALSASSQKRMTANWPKSTHVVISSRSAIIYAICDSLANAEQGRNEMSTRKPHNDCAGYVCELKSKHPKLSGHFVIFDRDKGGEWIADSDYRYAVIHGKPDGTFGCLICFKSLPTARAIMKDMATGSDIGDFGQHEKENDL